MRHFSLLTLGKLLAAPALALGLAGCFDANVDIDILSANSAHVTAVQTMNAETFAALAVQHGAADAANPPLTWFCADGDLNTAPNGDALCTYETRGRFRQFVVDDVDTGLSFKRLAADLVRVDIPVAAITAQFETEPLPGQQSNAMFAALFRNKTIALKISGGLIVASNLAIAEDEMSASIKLKFTDVLARNPAIPDAYFAVVRLP
jgi:hypothetical protein